MAFGSDRSRFVDNDFSGKRYMSVPAIMSLCDTYTLFK
jgi:hypothetical protein